MEHDAVVRVKLTGTPEQVRESYRQLLDIMSDITDMGIGCPVWNVELIHNTREHHRAKVDPDRQAWMLQDLDGFIDRSQGPPGPEDIRTYGPPDSRTLGL